MQNTLRVCLICLTLLALGACKTSEQKAEEFYQSGLSLLAAGDLDRAAIEFLNVFQHDGFHQDARLQLAQIRMQQGDIAAAYGQYLRLIEQYPDMAQVRLTLAEIAIDINNWDEAQRHGQVAIALVPDDPAAQSIGTALAYRAATRTDDTAAMTEIAATAQALLNANPEDAVARRVVISHLMRSDTPTDALPEIDRALALTPDSYAYHRARLQVLTQTQDMPAIGAQLERMVTLFPDDPELTQSLIGWYMAQDDLSGAENYLRRLAGDPTGPPEGHVVLIQFLQGAKGSAAARDELAQLTLANADTPNEDVYRTLAAAMDFEAGDQATALATFEDVLSDAPDSDQTRRIRNTYARLLIATDAEGAARSQVAQILEQDPANVDALKLRAAWLIADDHASEAILDLRQALGQQPRDAEVLTLMADAHEREGNRALAGERLALAFDINSADPATALRYAQFLLADGRAPAARSVLTEARKANARNITILTSLARLLVSAGAWTEAQGVANTLRSIDDPAAQEAATSLQAALLLGQNRVDDSLAFLQQSISQGNAATAAVTQVIEIHLQAGDIETARSTLDAALADAPDDNTLQMLNASLFALAGDFAAAEAVFRELIAANPQAEAPVLQLYNLLIATDQGAQANAVLNDALNAQPASLNLRWLLASQREAAGDIDGAIAIYEDMYATNSGIVTIANNLASLLATHRDDPDSISRAATIAKRLRELDVPQFQDTYGWIAYRQGNYEEARQYLEPAAAALSDDPLVQYHLGMTHAALGNNDAARAQLLRALDLAGDSPLPQFGLARKKLAEIAP